MRLIEDGKDHGATSTLKRSGLSRRSLLKISAIGASAGFAAGLPSFASAGEPNWTVADIPAQAGRKVLLTGGNGYPENGRSGLGYHEALALARSGADVTIASRDRARGEEAIRRILVQVPGAKVRFEALDLSNLASIRAFTTRMRASGQGLDLLVNNAGVMGRFDREVSVDGLERVFATNTLGHFVLAAELLPLLKKGRRPRIVWVSSLRASAGKLDLDELPLPRAYDYAAAYDNSKLANLMLALEFDLRSKALGWGVSSVASHPGVARTNLIPNGPGLNSREGRRSTLLPFMFRDPAQGALPILYAATTTVAEPGGYYGPAGFQELRGAPGVASIPAMAQDRQSAAALWTSLEQLGQLSTEYWRKG